jgi:hypothetical protein
VDGKLAFIALSLVEVILRFKFEDLSTNLKSKRLNLVFNFFTRGHDLTEVVISDAVKTTYLF